MSTDREVAQHGTSLLSARFFAFVHAALPCLPVILEPFDRSPNLEDQESRVLNHSP